MSEKEDWRFHLKNLGRELVGREREPTEAEVQQWLEESRQLKAAYDAQLREAAIDKARAAIEANRQLDKWECTDLEWRWYQSLLAEHQQQLAEEAAKLAKAEQLRKQVEEQARKAAKAARAQNPEKHYPTVWD
jgi:hypothetical protein